MGEDHVLGGKVHSQRQGVGAADHVQYPFAEGRLHQEFFLGEHPAVVDADAPQKRHVHIAHIEDLRQFVDPLPVGLAPAGPPAGDLVGQVHGPLLGEAEDQRVVEFFQGGRLLGREDQPGHPLATFVKGEGPPGDPLEVVTHGARPPEGGRHNQ